MSKQIIIGAPSNLGGMLGSAGRHLLPDTYGSGSSPETTRALLLACACWSRTVTAFYASTISRPISRIPSKQDTCTHSRCCLESTLASNKRGCVRMAAMSCRSQPAIECHSSLLTTLNERPPRSLSTQDFIIAVQITTRTQRKREVSEMCMWGRRDQHRRAFTQPLSGRLRSRRPVGRASACRP